MRRTSRFVAVATLAMLMGCQSQVADKAQPPVTPSNASLPASFGPLAAKTLDAHLVAHPERGVELGLHAYDGKLPSIDDDGLAREKQRLSHAIAGLEALDPASLTAAERVEHNALLTTLAADRFELEVRRTPWTNPMSYLGPLALTPYISRDYAPLDIRAKAIAEIAEATPAYLAQAQSNLEQSLPRTFVATALLQARGMATFVRVDVAEAIKSLPAGPLAARVDAALQGMAQALDGYAEFLVQRQSQANDAYALGPENFSAMLKQTQGIDVPLPRLKTVLLVDLQQNLKALDAAAAAIDPGKPVAEVVASVTAVKPAPEQVLGTATDQAVQMRRFLVDRSIVSIPTQDVAEVVPTPPFMRWNAAFLDSAGVFENKPLPSFYYISPPDPTWPPEKQRAYVPGTTDLLFITIHEVWPGHFLHGLHVKENPSRVLKSLWNYMTGEGWAHYTEQLMWDEGISEDPRVHVGQLLNALLRDVRALCAIGLHTEGMSVATCQKMFVTTAFQDEANAEQQAVRGTFDPMYLAYTVGKLAILKLREDLMKRDRNGFSLQKFHDEFLRHAAAPIGTIRESMLGEGPVL